MKIKDLFDKIENVSSIMLSLYNIKEKKPYKDVIYKDKDLLISEIGDLKIVEYSYGSFNQYPVIIIGYEVECE